MNLLVTGGCGFIGSNFIEHVINKKQISKLINLDCLSYAGSIENTTSFINHPKYIAQKCDIEVEHKLNCTQKAGFGDDDCHYCGFMNIHMMRKLGFENTIKGSWFKRTSNPKVLVIYE